MKWQTEEIYYTHTEGSSYLFSANLKKEIIYRNDEASDLIQSFTIGIFQEGKAEVGMITDVRHKISQTNQKTRKLFNAATKSKYQHNGANSMEFIDLLKKTNLIDEKLSQELEKLIHYQPPARKVDTNCYIV